MVWPVDKLTLINQYLALTGNNLCSVPDDGSDEWTVGSAAYEVALEYMLDQENWKQVTTVATLVATGIVPADDTFDTAYAKPPDCVHVIWVRLDDRPVPYQILNNQIVLNALGTIPGLQVISAATPGVATMKYVSSNPPAAVVNGAAVPAVDQMMRTFMTALGRFVMAGIYRGLHEDWNAAQTEERAAKLLLQEAISRSDQEEPKRAFFSHRITAARRIRRPWPPVPTGWGGTGTPG